ncbi:MAG: hypothetical protein A2167_07190 [Planctomycetes bacterium RBG_13_46_10]|nr:MAG: hypothetical protein A2167_07190 [Planctomycetes bacterium RBG_13_46_10]
MNMTKRKILRISALIICLCSLLVDNAFAAGNASYRKKPAGAYRNNQKSKVLNRTTNTFVYNQLARTVDLSALKFHTPFSQAIEILRNSTSPPLNIVVIWRDLSENAAVQRDTQIYMEGLSGISLSAGLELLLRAVSSSPEELGYIVEHGVIIIATRNSLPVRRVTRVYDISDLVAEPANYRFGMPFASFGLGAAGFGGGLMGQMPLGGLGGGFGNYGGSAGGYTRGTSLQYGSGLRSQRAGEIAGLINSSVAQSRWR